MTASTVFVVIAVILLIVFLVWATRISGRPESTAGHHDPRDDVRTPTTTEEIHGDHSGDRPAGADAEDTARPDSGIRWRGDPPDADAVGGESSTDRPLPSDDSSGAPARSRTDEESP